MENGKFKRGFAATKHKNKKEYDVFSFLISVYLKPSNLY